MDNDIYGHVNNVIYYSWVDTVINRYLIDKGGLDIHDGKVIGVAVESLCRFHRAFAFPETVEAGLTVSHIGSTSVRYELGLFGKDDEMARADGYFVHVFVDRESNRPQPVPDLVRGSLDRLLR